MSGSIGPLLPADERFDHQIVDTFATVAQTDPGWTEKVCGMACARDGSLQVAFGFGKYTNRDVMDGYGGVSLGVEDMSGLAFSILSGVVLHSVIEGIALLIGALPTALLFARSTRRA